MDVRMYDYISSLLMPQPMMPQTLPADPIGGTISGPMRDEFTNSVEFVDGVMATPSQQPLLSGGQSSPSMTMTGGDRGVPAVEQSFQPLARPHVPDPGLRGMGLNVPASSRYAGNVPKLMR